eukprot:NODE_681_length_2467_cov_80.979096_g585_i1.p1 GENE.NODE_681_length_2467_cov_80.979096_g585_i1~~NODE_681_length_2467_cov_80.979096_g585_i1.p1  ORF type:complete len:726 (+),score=127.95 NODE_681_length_2467_cov_80.979096_g585_i1:55-2232(+)
MSVEVGGLQVHPLIYDLVDKEIGPGTGISTVKFFNELGDIVRNLGPRCKELLNKRDSLQAQLDDYYKANRGKKLDQSQHKKFLSDIGYLVPEGPDFQVSTINVDREIAEVAGPQLVVPVDNARFGLNAANARWGSLFDAVYGSNIYPDEGAIAKGKSYNPTRGEKVFEFTYNFLDEAVGLERGSWSQAQGFKLVDVLGQKRLVVILPDGESGIASPSKFVGYGFKKGALSSLLLCNHGLHIDILVDKNHPVGRTHSHGIKDVILESAITNIQDFEDSVALVDASDKVRGYRNWLGLMKGHLSAKLDNGKLRELNPDREYHSVSGGTLTLPGRTLLLVRHVGHYMYTDAVTQNGQRIPEGFLDCMITILAALHDLKGIGRYKNSRTGSIYVVKPKQHGPEEVAFTVQLFEAVERALGLPITTIKVGIMDEERRTTVNLKECIRAAQDRTVFINTGFLDRTGDEIHSAMQLGPVTLKNDIKAQPCIKSYEDWNVDTGIICGLPGKAQIGKGMWPAPDAMKEMLEAKIGHILAGGNCAWVPSPTAATIHATHYHKLYVFKRQLQLASRAKANLDDILTPPILNKTLTPKEVQSQLDDNAQGILGYVVRWVDKGIGCSKVPDIHNVGLMEDRATLRISSQHIANWLLHGIVTEKQVLETMKRMAQVVDRQNASDRDYQPMTRDIESNTHNIAFQAALDLVFKGLQSPNGYTEDILFNARRSVKARKARL